MAHLHARIRFLAIIFIFISLLVAGCATDETNLEQQSSNNAESQARVAPVVELAGIDGGSLITSELEKPMILSFWASWCPHCKKELPILDSLYDEYKNEVEFVSVNITYDDTLSSAKSFIEDQGLQMPVYLDLDGIASQSYRVLAVPTIVIVSDEGTIVESRIGAIGERAENVFREMLDTLVSTAQ